MTSNETNDGSFREGEPPLNPGASKPPPRGHLLNRILARCALLTFREVVLAGIICGILIEAITLALRFGLQLESTRDTAMIGTMTLGLRIHHGYIGVFLIVLGWCFPLGIRNLLWMIGLGLVLSDLVHHFLVLWPITGDPQFDVIYPNHPFWKREP